MSLSAEEVYRRHVKRLPTDERVRLLAIIGSELAAGGRIQAAEQKPSVMDLHGLGKEIWDGIDAQDYVNSLRQEWESPS